MAFEKIKNMMGIMPKLDKTKIEGAKGMYHKLKLFADKHFELHVELKVPKTFWAESLKKVQRKFPALKKITSEDKEILEFNPKGIKMIQKKIFASEIIPTILNYENNKLQKNKNWKKDFNQLKFPFVEIKGIQIIFDKKDSENYRALIDFSGYWNA